MSIYKRFYVIFVVLAGISINLGVGDIHIILGGYMNDNNDWKEIEKFAKKEKDSELSEYGFDIRARFNNTISDKSIKKERKKNIY